ncbi:MAG: hypothetical protein JWP25_2052 [Bradyrhizobium sp.]|jgi:hypothetical protein|nr:hypothetical protein [Bradyrhizobium sp.]
MAALPIDLDRAARTPLATQIPLWWHLAHLESGREDLGGHEENRGAGAGTPLHIIGAAWSTNQSCWVEGALETAEAVASTLTRIPAT